MNKKQQSVSRALQRIASRKKEEPDIEVLQQEISSGNRVALSKAITLIESNLDSDQKKAREIVQWALQHLGISYRIGISGIPGVGKSTFIESLGLMLAEKGRKVAVLTIDPSSTRNGGSILGDKTRMQGLSANPSVYIRPSPSSGVLGGVARATRETIWLCEAAGFDTVLIETVGVGQSETEVASMTDFFVLLMMPGAGDELQGMKRGIIEMADALIVNKADGALTHQAERTKQEYAAALHLLPPAEEGLTPEVFLCSSTENKGIDKVWQNIDEALKSKIQDGRLLKRRGTQNVMWFRRLLKDVWYQRFLQNKQSQVEKLEQQISAGEISAYQAVLLILELND